MYDLCVFPSMGSGGLFRELEILSMTDSFYEAWKPLINPSMGMRLLEFFEEFEESGIRDDKNPIAEKLAEKIDDMHRALDHTITSMTIHLRIQQSNIINKVRANSFQSLKNMTSIERKEFKEAISDVLKYEEVWRYKILPRRKEDYLIFKEECKKLINISRTLDANLISSCGMSLTRTDDIMRRVNMSNNGFYDPKEKEVITKMGSLCKPNLGTMREMLDGIDFIEKTKESSISFQVYRTVKFRR